MLTLQRGRQLDAVLVVLLAAAFGFAVAFFVQRKGWGTQAEDTADALATLDWYCWDRRVDVKWLCQPAAGKLFAPQGIVMDASHKNAAARVLKSSLSFDRERR